MGDGRPMIVAGLLVTDTAVSSFENPGCGSQQW